MPMPPIPPPMNTLKYDIEVSVEGWTGTFKHYRSSYVHSGDEYVVITPSLDQHHYPKRSTRFFKAVVSETAAQ